MVLVCPVLVVPEVLLHVRQLLVRPRTDGLGVDHALGLKGEVGGDEGVKEVSVFV